MRLEGKRILVTAAGQGIGRAAAIACAREGARVVATDICGELLEGLQKEQPQIEVHRLDVLDGESIVSLASHTPALDSLFNCAGYVHTGTVLTCDEIEWAFSFNLNVTSMYRTIRAFLPGMIEKARSTGTTCSILNMASMASSIKGFPNRAAYGASKAAVIGLTKAVAADFVSQGVRCNAICPGTVDTPSLRARIAMAEDPLQAEKDFIARQPMGRLATVEDIVPQVIYLLSNESSFVTGQAILVDGGVTI